MIYESVEINDPIRQGDIFLNVPRVDLSLAEIAIVDDHDDQLQSSWLDLIHTGNASQGITAILPIIPVVLPTGFWK